MHLRSSRRNDARTGSQFPLHLDPRKRSSLTPGVTGFICAGRLVRASPRDFLLKLSLARNGLRGPEPPTVEAGHRHSRSVRQRIRIVEYIGPKFARAGIR